MNTDLGYQIGLSCIVFVMYIVGKVGMYHKFYKEDTHKETKGK
jgi:hypothetical protein